MKRTKRNAPVVETTPVLKLYSALDASNMIAELLFSDLGRMIDGYEKEKAAFMKRVDENPVDAIEWRASNMVKAQTNMQLAVQVSDWLMQIGPSNFVELQSALETFKDEAMRRLFNDIRDESQSSSMFSNASAACKNAVQRDFVRDILSHLAMYVKFAIKREEGVTMIDGQPWTVSKA